eukprot:g5880.t1
MNNNSTPKTQELAGVSPGTRGLTTVNSRVQQHERRKSIRLLGKTIELDEWLDWRVKWGQRGAMVSSFFGAASYILAPIHSIFGLFAISLAFIAICFGIMVYFRNVSFPILKRLLKEINVAIILMLSLFNFSIDLIKPIDAYSWAYGLTYVLVVAIIVFLDAVKFKSRVFVLFWGIVFAFINLNNIYHRVFSDSTNGMLLLQYTINGEQYDMRRRDIQRSIFVQVLCFAMNGLWTMIKDKKMEKMMFATGHIYRETGTASKYVEDRQ